MTKIIFIYLNNKYTKTIKNSNVLIANELKSYSSIFSKNIKKLYFLYNGKQLSINTKKKIIDFNKKHLVINVFNLDIKNLKKKEKIECVLCPECEEIATITFNKDKISIDNCPNNHKLSNLSIDEFMHFQNNNQSHIKCFQCKNNKSYYNHFFICTCGQYICPLCEKKHRINKDHKLIDYKIKNFICNKHIYEFVSYCNTCNINLCNKCEENHKTHKIMIYKKIIQNQKNELDKIYDYNTKINKYKKDFLKIKECLNNYINNILNKLDEYDIFYNYIFNVFQQLKNYENIKLIQNLKNYRFTEGFNNIYESIKNNLNYLLEKDRNKEILITYNINQNKSEIKLFGKEFVNNNKSNCHLLINNNRNEICEYYSYDEMDRKKKLIIKLIITKEINNMSYMFYKCDELSQIMTKIDTSNVTNMSYMFYGCESLFYLPDISNWNIFKAINMFQIFYGCKSLLSTPNIFNWNTFNSTDISEIISDSKKLHILYNNNNNIKNINKKKTSFLSKNKSPVFILNSKFHSLETIMKSNCFFISKDIIIVMTKYIYDYIYGYTCKIIIKDLKIEYNDNFLDNIIIENKRARFVISIIKLKYEEIILDYYFEIEPNINISFEDKFIIDNKDEKPIEIYCFKDNEFRNYIDGTPIFVKKMNKKYLIGIINNNNFYIFNKEELSFIKNIYENYQIEGLNFFNNHITDNKLNSILEMNFYNLKYLNLENNNISNEGLKYLENQICLEYLNLSKNKIDDRGLYYLKNLSHLKELIILDMRLSDECFLVLDNFNFYSNINNIECDKKNLILERINENFKSFKLKNLSSIKFLEIKNNLKVLFSLNNISSPLKMLDLSNTNLSDYEMLRIKKNISKMKSIEAINLENTKLTIKSKNYLNYFNELKIKILIDQTKLLPKPFYQIVLVGSTISGKTSYYRYCTDFVFVKDPPPTIGFDHKFLNPSFNKGIKVKLWDTSYWGGRYDSVNKILLQRMDGILLLFDVTSEKDFEGLNNILTIITQYYDLDIFPVLLIANKIDLNEKRQINAEEIREFQKQKKLIGYFEVSCKCGINVKESFDFLINYIIEREK